jgi:hypothetical protein
VLFNVSVNAFWSRAAEWNTSSENDTRADVMINLPWPRLLQQASEENLDRALELVSWHLVKCEIES